MPRAASHASKIISACSRSEHGPFHHGRLYQRPRGTSRQAASAIAACVYRKNKINRQRGTFDTRSPCRRTSAPASSWRLPPAEEARDVALGHRESAGAGHWLMCRVAPRTTALACRLLYDNASV